MTPKQVRRLRLDLGETQEQFAARLGVSKRALCGWEAGTNRPSPMAMKLLEKAAKERKT